MTRVYVAVAEGSQTIVGYYAISMGEMSADKLTRPPRGTPRDKRVPVLYLGQIAVDLRAQGQSVGTDLMSHAYQKACAIAAQVGCYALILDVLSDDGEDAFQRRCAWYAKLGFEAFAGNAKRMFIRLAKPS